MAINLVQGKQIATASWAVNALTASYIEGGSSSFPFTGSALITGSLGITGSLNVTQGITGSLFGTASFAVSSSRAVSASFASTASIVQSIANNITNNVNNNVLTATGGTTINGEGNLTFNGSLLNINGLLEQGSGVLAIGDYSHAEGNETQAIGNHSHAEGESTQAIGESSHAEGQETQALGEYSHAEGNATITGTTTAFYLEKNAIIDGGIELPGDQRDFFTPGGYLYVYDVQNNTKSTYLIRTVTFDSSNTVIQLVDTAVNIDTAAFGDITYLLNNGTFGSNSTIPGNYSHTEGNETQVIGDYSHAEGRTTQAIGNYSHTEGRTTQAIGNYSHAEGRTTQAIGNYSHAEGSITQAIGESSHAEGADTVASGSYSHAEGSFTQTIGEASHAEGAGTVALGVYSHAEGVGTLATERGSHAEGFISTASGDYSHAEGLNTIASGAYQHVQGQYNIPSTAQSAFIIGNGTDDNNRSNLVFAAGTQVEITGSLNVTQGITGSLFGTSSWAINAVSSSNALTASYVNILNQNIQISGSLKLDPTQDPDPSGLDLDSTVLFQSSSNTTLGYDLYVRQNGNLVKWKWIEGILETGLLYGGVVTYSGSNVFVSPGSAIIVEHNATTGSEVSPMVEYITWNAITQSITNIATQQVTYLYIDQNGALQQQSTRFTPQQYHDYIPLGAAGHFDFTQVSAFGGGVQTAYDQISQTSNFIDAFGPLKTSGYGLTGQAGSLRLSVGTGNSFIHGGFYQNDPEFPSQITTPAQATASIAYVYRSGSGVQFDTNGGALYTTVNPTQYDRDGDGTLENVGNGNWSIQRVFSDPKTGVLYVYYGQERYPNLLNALQYLPTDPFTEGDTFDFTTFIGYLVLKGNASDITDTADNRIVNGGLFRGSGQGSGGGIALSNLDDLTDVSIISPTNGQALVYNAGIWENGTPASASFASTASFATSASWAPSQAVDTSSLATTGSNTFVGNQVITGSLTVTQGITGSLFGTASFATTTPTDATPTSGSTNGVQSNGVFDALALKADLNRTKQYLISKPVGNYGSVTGTTAQTVLLSIPILGGVYENGDYLGFNIWTIKDGTAATTTITVRAGTTGTTSDSVLGLLNQHVTGQNSAASEREGVLFEDGNFINGRTRPIVNQSNNDLGSFVTYARFDLNPSNDWFLTFTVAHTNPADEIIVRSYQLSKTKTF